MECIKIITTVLTVSYCYILKVQAPVIILIPSVTLHLGILNVLTLKSAFENLIALFPFKDRACKSSSYCCIILAQCKR